jgi:hypothetical protein
MGPGKAPRAHNVYSRTILTHTYKNRRKNESQVRQHDTRERNEREVVGLVRKLEQ